FDASDTILNGFSDDIAKRVTKRLCETGVTVRTGERISVIKSGQIEFESGDAFQADIIVWAAGVKAPEAIAELSVLQRTNSGQIKVNNYLQSTGDPSVYAIGDCSSYIPEGGNIPLPPTGQVARQQAEYLARSIQLIFAGKELKPFQYVDRGNLVSLSVFGAYGNVAKQGILPQLALRGPLAILVHKAFYRMHQFALHGAIKGSVLMLRDWLNTLVKPPVRMD
ncbi:MAG: FAD-dependent oxidoreductase, partial [Pseudomonadota bacterium]